MRLINIGIANVNPTVGAFASNTKKVIAYAREMAEKKCTLGAFSEQVIGGYPAEDLVQWKHFLEGQWQSLLEFTEATKSFPFSTVFVLGVAVLHNGHIYNTAAVVSNGVVHGIVPKEKLPTYGVFYENRTLSHGIPGYHEKISKIPFGDFIFKAPFGVFAVEVCEDIWSPDGPMRRRAYSGAELIVNISASPFRIGILETRRELIATRASDNQVTLVYANQVGGNDALVFDGGGFVNQNGRMLFSALRWCEGLSTQVVDLDRTARIRSENTTWRTDAQRYTEHHPRTEAVSIPHAGVPNHESYRYPIPQSKNFFLPDFAPVSARDLFFDDLVQAMVASLDYFVKTGAFQKIGVALSGGKDSALTLIVAWIFAKRLLGGNADAVRSFIRCFSMPTRFNSETTKDIARTLASELGVSFEELPISDAFEREQEAVRMMVPPGEALSSSTLQNIQARIRAERMWNWANAEKGLWLQTGNMSEKAVGYTTIGGDLMGGYSLIGNLPKTIIVELLKYLGEKYPIPSIEALLKTKASAELRHDQEDERDLMPYPVLDACFALFAGEKLSPLELYRALRGMWTEKELCEMRPGYTPDILKEWVKQFVLLFISSVFKWVQAPETAHLGPLDLDRERALQLPVVQSREWLMRSLEEISREKT